MKFSLGLQTENFTPLRIACGDPHCAESIAVGLDTLLLAKSRHQPVVIVCVGTDRSTGDALGPFVGSLLQKNSPRNGFMQYHLYGTIDQPVHAVNLEETIQDIRNRFVNPFIIAIDACLGQSANVGCIQLCTGPVKPGAGVNKELPSIGDIHLTGIVNVGGFMEYFVLQNTRLSIVIRMAEVIAEAIHAAFSHFHESTVSPIAKID